MALQSSGAISLSNVNVELKYSATAVITMNDAAVRKLLAVPSGSISLSNAYGKANEFLFTISTNQANVNLRTLLVNAGWDQASKAVVTIDSGVIVSSDSVATPALTIDGAFPAGILVTNNGHIVGKGGNGANNTDVVKFDSTEYTYAQSGGLAMLVSSAVTISNNGVIGGGGGGGGYGGNAGWWDDGDWAHALQGGAGGGGAGFGSGGAVNITPGGITGDGNPGASGGLALGGLGGFGATLHQGWADDTICAGDGGPGGDLGAAGADGQYGGYWASSGALTNYNSDWHGGYGGTGGAAVSGNANITWVATGTRYGAIA